MPKPGTKIGPNVIPSPALEKRTRRMFSTDYKLSIIRQADACQHGELLRREKLYSNQLSQWRRELEQHGVDGLKKSTPGPAPKKSADQKRIERLEKENNRLRKQAELQNGCLALQKKPWIY